MKKYLMISALSAFCLMASDSSAMDRQFRENRSGNLECKLEPVKDSFVRNQKVNERLSKPKVFLSKASDVSKKIWTNAGKICLCSFSGLLIFQNLCIPLLRVGLASAISKMKANCCEYPDLHWFGMDAF